MDKANMANILICEYREILTRASIAEGAADYGFYNLNTVNNFHSYIKKQYNDYRGVATKYLNRYNALFTIAWRRSEAIISSLCTRLLKPGPKDYHYTIRNIRESRLLVI